MKLDKILFGTANKNKLKDVNLQKYPNLKDLNLYTLFDFQEKYKNGEAIPEVDETENTYLGNCLLKAKAYSKWSKLPCIADDSGLEVFALNREPGVYSAHYAGDLHNDKRNNEKLIQNLKGITDRSARFVSVIVLHIPEEDGSDWATMIFEGEVKGQIVDEPRGNAGWGYEPHFVLDGYGKTLAELREEGIDFISHRKIALDKLWRLWSAELLLG